MYKSKKGRNEDALLKKAQKELLIPKIDVIFHSLFRVVNEEITKAIISDILESKIKTIDLDNDKYLVKEITNEKLGILDLKSKLNNGTMCNIESQLVDKGNTVPRVLSYWSKMNGSQLKECDDYNKLEKCISILILDYELKDMKKLREIQEQENVQELKQMKECHIECEIFEKKRKKLILTDKLEIHIIEMSKAIKGKKEKEENMEKEKIDILLTTYNTNIQYLKEQIDSILNQTYTNITLIISDDKSPNKEVQEVLKGYEKQDSRIKLYIQENNLGYIKNFEFLLSKSTAKYIMFSDHDDVWYKEKVEKTFNKLIKDDVDLVYCNANQIDEKGKIIQEDYFKYKNVPLIQKHGKLAISRCIGIGCSQMITKSVKDKMIPFTKEVMAHDWLAAFVANENKGIAFIEDKLFGYRLHNTNVFGGRNLSQNLARWKEKNGKTYKAFLKYRKENVIDKAYLDGAVMCMQYAKNEQDKEFLKELIEYYKNIEKSKYLNLNFGKYSKFLSGKNLLKKKIKEILIFHFPVLSYLVYLIG